MSRCVLVLVGGGNVGKTTLCKRLRGVKKIEDLTKTEMTDGIDVNRVSIKSKGTTVQFTIFDFAGQKEYAHTHSLFFNDAAIYLLMYKPACVTQNHDSNRSSSTTGEERLAEFKEYLEMIDDFAPNATILVVTTHAQMSALSENQFAAERKSLQKLIDEYRSSDQRSVEIINIDSVYPESEGTGIDQLKLCLVEVATQQKGVKVQVPGSLVALEKELEQLEYKTMFSMKWTDFQNIRVKEAEEGSEINPRFFPVYRDMLLHWGSLKELSNGDLVLHPQQLADVLACVVSRKQETLNRIGLLNEGILKHNDETLRLVWGSPADTSDSGIHRVFEERLWKVDPATGRSAFLDLLYSSQLAYPLCGSDGLPLNLSIVPAMLPSSPTNFDMHADHLDLRLFNHFFSSEASGTSSNKVESLIVTFNRLPSTFLARLHVKLSPFTTVGSAWKTGFKIFKDGGAIIYQRDTNRICIVVDRDCGDRFVALKYLLQLRDGERQFASLCIKGCQLLFGDESFDLCAEKELVLSQGALTTQGAYIVKLQSVQLFLRSISHKSEYVDFSKLSNSVEIIEKHQPLQSLRDISYQFHVSHSDEAYNSTLALVERTFVLKDCIPLCFQLLGRDVDPSKFMRKLGLGALWVLLEKLPSENSFYLVPVTPMPSLMHWQVLDVPQAWIKVAIEGSITGAYNEISRIMYSALSLKNFPFMDTDNVKWKYLGLTGVVDGETLEVMSQREMKYFEEVVGGLKMSIQYKTDFLGT